VSTLVGALWTSPVAQIMEVGVDENGDFVEDTLVEVAGGFHAIGDFDFYGTDYLLVLELNPGSPFIPFSGRLTKVDLMTGETTVLAESELVAPSGIVVDGDMVYITNNTYAEEGMGTSSRCQGHVIMASLMTDGEHGEEGTPTASPVAEAPTVGTPAPETTTPPTEESPGATDPPTASSASSLVGKFVVPSLAAVAGIVALAQVL
jgi:hypothetical protein